MADLEKEVCQHLIVYHDSRQMLKLSARLGKRRLGQRRPGGNQRVSAREESKAIKKPGPISKGTAFLGHRNTIAV